MKSRTAFVAALTCALSGVVGFAARLEPVGATVSGCTNPPPNLAAWWDGDGSAHDLLGGNDGTLVGATATASGKVGTGFGLDGVDDRVEIPDQAGPAASVSVTGEISVDAWIKPNTVTANRAIVAKYDASIFPAPIGVSWLLETVGDGRLLWLVYGPGGNTYRQVESTDVVVSAGVFTHVSATFDPATQAMVMYVNGQTVDATLEPGSSNIAEIHDSTAPVTIGVFRGSGNLEGLFDGVIDEVGLYAHALDPAEVAAIHAADTAGKCKWTPELASVDGAETNPSGLAWWPSVSRDSRFVAFEADEGLVPEDTNAATDIYVRDRLLGTTELVSVDTAGGAANAGSRMAWISGDGRKVAWYSQASDLVAGDTNGFRDVFVRDLASDATERVSVVDGPAGAEANAPSSNAGAEDRPVLSYDGRYVVFSSDATNLVPGFNSGAGDTNGKMDYFLRDLHPSAGTTELISVNSVEVQGSGDSPGTGFGFGGMRASISDGGQFVAFASLSNNLAGTDGAGDDIFVRDRVNGTTELISASADPCGCFAAGQSVQPVISADGRYVAFSAGGPALASPHSSSGNTIYIRDRQPPSGPPVTQSVSVKNNGGATNQNAWGVALSPDGRRVAWQEGLFGPKIDVFVKDLDAPASVSLRRVSFPAGGGVSSNHSFLPALSAHPGLAVFSAFGDDVVPGDADGSTDIVVHHGDDLTPPVITPVVTGTLGDNDWYTSDVNVSWTLTDPESSVISQEDCGPTSVTTDTTAAGVTFTCHAMSGAEPASASVTVKRDATAPTIGHTVAPVSPDGANGWYVTAPTVTFSCNDATSPGSGLASCLADGETGASKTLGQNANPQSVPGTATDLAGNQTPDSATGLKVDLANPTIGHTVSPTTPDGTNGWYKTAPTVTFNCGDSASGVATCLANGQPGASKTLAESASVQSVSGTTFDVAGRSNTDSVSGLKVDLSNPTVTCAAVPTFTRGEVGAEVTASVSDAISGAAAPTVSAPANTSLLGAFAANVTGTDLAGRSTIVPCSYSVINERSFSVNNASVTEGNSGTKTVTFSVSLSTKPRSGQTASVKVTTANGTATAVSDYTAVPLTTLTWTSTDALSKTVSVTVSGDVLKEGNETLSLNLSAPVKAVLADSSGQATIIDEEGPFYASVTDASVTEGNSGTKNMVFTVSLPVAPATGQTAAVRVATSDGTGNAVSDYTAVPLTTLTFTAGQKTKTVNVVIKGDTAVEPNETLALTLSALSNSTVIADTQGLGTIVNDDGTPGAAPLRTFAVSNVYVVEGNSGTKVVNFSVSLSAKPPTGQTASVKVATANVTAAAGTDYTAVPLTTLTWTSTDALTKTVAVTITGDTVKENNEAFNLVLSGQTNAGIADSFGQAVIVDEEGPLFVRVSNAAVNEGSGSTTMTFAVSLAVAPATGQTATVKVATASGTATAGSDYTAVPLTTLTFTAGQVLKLVTVTISGDGVAEGHETVFLNLSAPSANVVIVDTQGVGTIVNDD